MFTYRNFSFNNYKFITPLGMLEAGHRMSYNVVNITLEILVSYDVDYRRFIILSKEAQNKL